MRERDVAPCDGSCTASIVDVPICSYVSGAFTAVLVGFPLTALLPDTALASGGAERSGGGVGI